MDDTDCLRSMLFRPSVYINGSSASLCGAGGPFFCVFGCGFIYLIANIKIIQNMTCYSRKVEVICELTKNNILFWRC